jgi:hypothetical protein
LISVIIFTFLHFIEFVAHGMPLAAINYEDSVPTFRLQKLKNNT